MLYAQIFVWPLSNIKLWYLLEILPKHGVAKPLANLPLNPNATTNIGTVKTMVDFFINFLVNLFHFSKRTLDEVFGKHHPPVAMVKESDLPCKLPGSTNWAKMLSKDLKPERCGWRQCLHYSCAWKHAQLCDWQLSNLILQWIPFHLCQEKQTCSIAASLKSCYVKIISCKLTAFVQSHDQSN